jgi:hypothetical protein
MKEQFLVFKGKRTNNTTAKGKGQTIQRLKEKDKQYNG